jgi:hypothetical protein
MSSLSENPLWFTSCRDLKKVSLKFIDTSSKFDQQHLILDGQQLEEGFNVRMSVCIPPADQQHLIFAGKQLKEGFGDFACLPSLIPFVFLCFFVHSICCYACR